MKHFFLDKWDEEPVYFLGILAAAGEDQGTNEFDVRLPGVELAWLRQVQAIIGIKTSRKDGFRFKSKSIVDKLWRLQDEYQTIAQAVPREIFQHFVRGMYDAAGEVLDGGMVLHGKGGTLKATRKLLATLINLPKNAPLKDTTAGFTLTYHARHTAKILLWLYRQAEIFREGKRQLLERVVDEPRIEDRTGSKRPGRPGQGGQGLRSGTRKGQEDDQLVWAVG